MTGRFPFRIGAALATALLGSAGIAATETPRADSDTATIAIDGDQARFGDETLAVQWHRRDDRLTDMQIVFADTTAQNGNNAAAPTAKTLTVTAPFALTFADGATLTAGDLRLQGPIVSETLTANAKASRLAEREPGLAAHASFVDAQGRLRIDWRLLHRRGPAYLREEIAITALKQDEAIRTVHLLQMQAADAQVIGDVKGSPVVAGDVYVGFEHPLAQSQVRGGRIDNRIERALPLRRGQTIRYSAVVGLARPGQMRRDFAAYIERERAHPYRPFLHYNSWYDLGYFTPYTQAQALDRIRAIGEALTIQRGVPVDSFLFDDGWDDLSGQWRFSKDFPNGFVPLREAAAKYHAAPGVWLSPWGGYSKPKRERVARGEEAGYEVVKDGFALSGPKYYRRFHEVVLDLLGQQGINQFKFDGTGNADSVFPGSAFDSDFAAAIQLIDDIRAAKPDTYINLTTGTYPSPFWLRYADSIWRGGEDDDLVGVGSQRERWITYRDEQTYRNIVEQGPLFPLNSLMLHGIIYAQFNPNLHDDPGNDFVNEVRSYFASGTQLQELYLTPSLLKPADWDALAAASAWSRANAEALRDTHWIGGDPGRLDVYGWAAWSAEKSILTLRNPDAVPRTALLEPRRDLQLPETANTRFRVKNLWGEKTALPEWIDANEVRTLTLAPFQVLTLELTPQR